MSRFRKKQAADPAPNERDVIHWLMQIDPPPPMGDSWLDGVADGIYQVQCHLRGRAQGQAMNGNYAAAVETAKTAVGLNVMRQFDEPEPITEEFGMDERKAVGHE